jgi:hypothetical protein
MAAAPIFGGGVDVDFAEACLYFPYSILYIDLPLYPY